MAKKTKKELQESLKVKRFWETLSLCGDEKQAARLVGLGMQKAYRALSDPDGIDELERHNQDNAGVYYTMSKVERMAFLTKCVLSGAMPRVEFDFDTGEPKTGLVYDPMSQQERMKALDMINKMDGVYVEKRINEDANRIPDIIVDTGISRSPTDKIDDKCSGTDPEDPLTS